MSAQDSTKAADLFKKNNMSPDNLVFTRLMFHDTISNSQGTTVYQHLFAVQYFNGLPVLFTEAGYHFRDEVYWTEIGTVYQQNQAPSDTRPVLTLPQMRALFMNQVNKDGYMTTLKDSCLVAEHGYYDLNVGISYSTPKLVKAWAVTPAHSSYPQAVFRDDKDGTLIYYFDGIETANRSPR